MVLWSLKQNKAKAQGPLTPWHSYTDIAPEGPRRLLLSLLLNDSDDGLP